MTRRAAQRVRRGRVRRVESRSSVPFTTEASRDEEQSRTEEDESGRFGIGQGGGITAQALREARDSQRSRQRDQTCLEVWESTDDVVLKDIIRLVHGITTCAVGLIHDADCIRTGRRAPIIPRRDERIGDGFCHRQRVSTAQIQKGNSSGCGSIARH